MLHTVSPHAPQPSGLVGASNATAPNADTRRDALSRGPSLLKKLAVVTGSMLLYGSGQHVHAQAFNETSVRRSSSNPNIMIQKVDGSGAIYEVDSVHPNMLNHFLREGMNQSLFLPAANVPFFFVTNPIPLKMWWGGTLYRQLDRDADQDFEDKLEAIGDDTLCGSCWNSAAHLSINAAIYATALGIVAGLAMAV